jgi:uncharacterized protein (DUF924 family)
MKKDFQPTNVLDFWFPDSGHHCARETHAEFWKERTHGGMDPEIRSRFANHTKSAAAGQLDHWADTPRGRLALLIALDQFPDLFGATRLLHLHKTKKQPGLHFMASKLVTSRNLLRGKWFSLSMR